MTKSERAAQIWPLLVFAASRRATLSYDLAGRLIGVPKPGLGQLLEPIQSYCILNSLPPLSVLVVSEITGMPGEGFVAAENVPRAQAEVYAHDWLDGHAPTPNELDDAARRLPSNNKSLDELHRLALTV
jgi:hypothetical protein